MEVPSKGTKGWEFRSPVIYIVCDFCKYLCSFYNRVWIAKLLGTALKDFVLRSKFLFSVNLNKLIDVV